AARPGRPRLLVGAGHPHGAAPPGGPGDRFVRLPATAPLAGAAAPLALPPRPYPCRDSPAISLREHKLVDHITLNQTHVPVSTAAPLRSTNAFCEWLHFNRFLTDPPTCDGPGTSGRRLDEQADCRVVQSDHIRVLRLTSKASVHRTRRPTDVRWDAQMT